MNELFIESLEEEEDYESREHNIITTGPYIDSN